ncbi:MAG: AAA family ATPase [Candidatus Nanoarchaeia archaeon]
MRIAISGSVGVGKTTIATQLAQKLQFQCIHANDIAKQFKIEEQQDLQTFDFDIKQCLNYIEKEYAQSQYIIFEGHFTHLLSPDFIDIIIIINRDLQELREEYTKRQYTEMKIKDNLEVESLNVCFYEAEEEGHEEHHFIVIENTQELDVEDIVLELFRKIQKKKKNTPIRVK